MLSTSGPWPEVAAARMRLSRSAQPITSSLTVMPVCDLNLSSSGWSTCLSLSRLVPWLLAQYVSVTPALEPEPELEPLLPHAASSGDTRATVAASRPSLRSLMYGAVLSHGGDGWVARAGRGPAGWSH